MTSTGDYDSDDEDDGGTIAPFPSELSTVYPDLYQEYKRADANLASLREIYTKEAQLLARAEEKDRIWSAGIWSMSPCISETRKEFNIRFHNLDARMRTERRQQLKQLGAIKLLRALATPDGIVSATTAVAIPAEKEI